MILTGNVPEPTPTVWKAVPTMTTDARKLPVPKPKAERKRMVRVGQLEVDTVARYIEEDTTLDRDDPNGECAKPERDDTDARDGRKEPSLDTPATRMNLFSGTL